MMESHAGASDDDFHATRLGSFGKLLHGIRGAVGGKGVHLKGNLLFLKPFASFLHHRKVACGTHDNTN